MRVKYPRTPHLPWSPGATSDDARLHGLDGLEGHEVVVTEKLDGENTTLYRDGLHARSVDSAHHPSRAPIKALHARIAHRIPETTRICGENLVARHSIPYADLDGWFYGFSVWDGEVARSWDDTVDFCRGLGLPTPRVRYRGLFDRKRLRKLSVQRDREEGYVVRRAASFHRDAFPIAVAKWVRPGHVQTDAHWMHQPVVPNRLGPDAVLWTIRSGGPIDHEALALRFGGVANPIDLPELGDLRLATVLAARLRGAYRSELLPVLAGRLGTSLGRSVADLIGLAPLLERAIPEEKRLGGLRTLARSVDLRALHAVAGDTEGVRWSRLVAEEAGLLVDDPFARFREALSVDPIGLEHRLHLSLTALSAGRIASPEEAVVLTHGKHPPGVLNVLVGPAGVGKSSVAASYPGPVVELDALRERHDDALSAGLKQLEAQRGIGVWDATCLTRQQRDLPLAVARRHGVEVHLVCVLTPRETAEARNQSRRRTVPASVVAKQWHRVKWPYPHEAAALIDRLPEASDANQ